MFWLTTVFGVLFHVSKTHKMSLRRIPPIYEKLSDQFVYWAKFRYTPKGQLGKIL